VVAYIVLYIWLFCCAILRHFIKPFLLNFSIFSFIGIKILSRVSVTFCCMLCVCGNVHFGYLKFLKVISCVIRHLKETFCIRRKVWTT